MDGDQARLLESEEVPADEEMHTENLSVSPMVLSSSDQSGDCIVNNSCDHAGGASVVVLEEGGTTETLGNGRQELEGIGNIVHSPPTKSLRNSLKQFAKNTFSDLKLFFW